MGKKSELYLAVVSGANPHKGRNKPENHHVFKFGSSNTLPQKNNFKRLACELMVLRSCMERSKLSLSLAKTNLSNFCFSQKSLGRRTENTQSLSDQ